MGSRQTTIRVFGLGGSAEEILRNTHTNGGFGHLEDVLLGFAEPVATSARQHLAFPELQYFRSQDRQSAIQLAVAILDDVLTLFDCGAREPIDASIVRTLRSAIGNFISTSTESMTSTDVPPLPHLKVLQDAGVATLPESEYQKNAKSYDDRRRELSRAFRQAEFVFKLRRSLF